MPPSAQTANGGPRWRTAWWLMLGALVVGCISCWLAWSDYSSAQSFARSAHQVRAVVVERDCAVLCKGGPFVSVSYDHPARGRVVGRLEGRRDVAVGDEISVVYSDDPAMRDVVVLPPARASHDSSSRLSARAGVVALAIAFAAWAFPANLRRLDRRDRHRANRPGPL